MPVDPQKQRRQRQINAETPESNNFAYNTATRTGPSTVFAPGSCSSILVLQYVDYGVLVVDCILWDEPHHCIIIANRLHYATPRYEPVNSRANEAFIIRAAYSFRPLFTVLDKEQPCTAAAWAAMRVSDEEVSLRLVPLLSRSRLARLLVPLNCFARFPFVCDHRSGAIYL